MSDVTSSQVVSYIKQLALICKCLLTDLRQCEWDDAA